MSRLIAARRRGAFPTNATTLRLTEHAPTHYDSDSSKSEVDEETRRATAEHEDEEEQERRLSEQHGEAAEASSSTSRKRGTSGTAKTDEEIEAEYAKARAKKKPRPTLTIAQLVGRDGLIRIRQEFPSSLRYPRCHGPNVRHDVDAAATYSRKLVAAYQSLFYDLCPSLAFEDLLLRVDTMGSKKEVKSFLQQMRDDVRNAHVERFYGKEKAEKMIRELELGLKQDNSVVLRQYFAPTESDLAHDNDSDSDDGENSDHHNSSDDNINGGTLSPMDVSNDMASPIELSPYITAAVATTTVNPYQKGSRQAAEGSITGMGES